MKLILILGITFALLNPASAVVLLQDGFSTAGNLNGTSPTVSNIGAVAWQARTSAPALTSNGSVVSADTATASRGVLDLGASYIIDHPGTYTLSLDVTFPTVSASTAWVGLGFTSAYTSGNTGFSQTDGTGGSPWIMLRATGAVNVYRGVGANNDLVNIASGYPGGATYNLKLVLNTQSTNWTLDAYVGATQLDLNGGSAGQTYTFANGQNPSVRYVGFSTPGTSGGPVAALDNFKLEMVPEPQVTVLLGLGAAVLVFGFRRSRNRTV